MKITAWITTGSTYVQQKLSEAAAKTRDKVLSIAIPFFLSLITALYSLFYPPSSDSRSNNDVSTEPPAFPRPVIPPGTFYPLQQEGSPFQAPDEQAPVSLNQRKDDMPPVIENHTSDSKTNLPDAEVQLIESSKQQRKILDSPALSRLVPPPSPVDSPTPVAVRNIQQQAPSPSSQLLSTESLVAPSNAFLDLPITEEEKKAISAFMKKSAEVSTFIAVTLVPQSEQIKRKYGHIHPLRSLAHFVTDPETKGHLRTIMGNKLKRAGYMNDFRPRIEAHKDIHLYLPGFCTFVKADFKHVVGLLSEKKFDLFIDHLLTL